MPQKLVKKLKPTFCSIGELKLREPEALAIEDDHDGYNSASQTPDQKIKDVEERMNWKPHGGVGVLYDETWADCLEKAKITSRSVILTFNLGKMRLMYIGAYLPTRSNDNSSFKSS